MGYLILEALTATVILGVPIAICLREVTPSRVVGASFLFGVWIMTVQSIFG